MPTRIYFSGERSRAKVEIALARGKDLYDKRESIRKARHAPATCSGSSARFQPLSSLHFKSVHILPGDDRLRRGRIVGLVASRGSREAS